MAYAMPYRDPTAVIGRRIGAYVIDALLMGVIVMLLSAGLVQGRLTEEKLYSDARAEARCEAVNAPEPADPADRDRICFPLNGTAYLMDASDILAIYGTFFLVYLGVAVLDLVVLQGLTGASVGKHAVGLRVVREDGSPAGLGGSALRTLLLVFVDGFCFVGLITMCVSKGHRRVGDMAASTFVVDKGDAGQPVLVPGLTAAPAWPTPGYGTGAGGPGYGPPAPGGWGQAGPGYGPPGPGGWGPPAPGPSWPQTPPVLGPPATAAPDTDGPHWDPERDTYITFDRSQQAWLEWDEAVQRWVPISTA